MTAVLWDIASDAENDGVSYSLSMGDTGLFSVGVTDGEISYNGGEVDSDTNYTLLVSATDVLGASASATVTVLVRSLSANSAPSFDVASYEFTVSDSGVVGTVIASDAENDGVSYSLSMGDTGLFSVGVTDGEISYNGGEVDSDTNYTLLVSATDVLGAIDSATVTVLVRSLSGNSAPSFDVASYEFTVSDSGVVGTVIASDAENDGVSYSLSMGDTGLFSVGVTDGEISYNGGEVDSDTNYTLLVSATDVLGASASATVTVLVRSLSANSAPSFDVASYEFTVSDSGVVGTVIASDAENDGVSYSLSVGDPGLFSVGVTDGEISYNGGEVDSDTNYTLLVSATDVLGAIDSATVTVLVRSLSANMAPEFDVASYEFTVSDSGVVGTVIASDAENDGVSYSLSMGDTGLFSVGVTDGEISYNGGEVDSDTNYTLLVSATDTLGAIDSATVTVLVRSLSGEHGARV